MPPEPALSQSLLSELLELAVATARQAGSHALAAGDSIIEVRTKSSADDLVTQVDQDTEQLIVEHLLTHRPHDGVAGEEGTSITGTSGVRWHIDPIDGTTNYVYDQPGWAVSIAAEAVGTTSTDPFDAMAVGVVFDPRHDDLYRAAKGLGAHCNDGPIHPRSTTELASVIIATGFAYDPALRRHQANVVAEILPEIGNIRRFGSAAVDLCLVAAGRVDAYYESGLNLWDLAAGALIASEAGALVHDLRGGPPGKDLVFAASPSCHDAVRDLLVSAGANDSPNPSGRP